MTGESIDLTARVYHTENGNVHAEGETYAVTDPALAETLYAIGFVSIEGWTPPPPPDGRHRGPSHGRGSHGPEIIHDDRRDR
jgi:hypothetical protein